MVETAVCGKWGSMASMMAEQMVVMSPVVVVMVVVVVVMVVVVVVVVVVVMAVVIQTAIVAATAATNRPSHVTCHALQTLLSMNPQPKLSVPLRNRIVNFCSTTGNIAHGKSGADGHDAAGGLKRVCGCKVRLSYLEAIL